MMKGEGDFLSIAVYIAAAAPTKLLRNSVKHAGDQQLLVRDAMDALLSGV